VVLLLNKVLFESRAAWADDINDYYKDVTGDALVINMSGFC
jgi:hypothetical protein